MAATSAVRMARAEALRELGRLLLEAAAMHCEVSAANGAGTEVRVWSWLPCGLECCGTTTGPPSCCCSTSTVSASLEVHLVSACVFLAKFPTRA